MGRKNLEHLKVNIDYIKATQNMQFDLQGLYSCHFSENWYSIEKKKES